MFVAGLTGGIASGKSTVSGYLRQAGAVIVDADRIAREVTQPGNPAYDGILQVFGSKILDESGQIDRSLLANIVFREQKQREKLNNIVHPYVFQALESEKKRQKQRSLAALIIFDAPLLIEVGAHTKMDCTILVYIDPESQILRLMKRDGFTKEDAKLRLKAQMPIEQKRDFAHYIVDNRVSREEVRTEVQRLYLHLCEKMTS